MVLLWQSPFLKSVDGTLPGGGGEEAYAHLVSTEHTGWQQGFFRQVKPELGIESIRRRRSRRHPNVRRDAPTLAHLLDRFPEGPPLREEGYDQLFLKAIDLGLPAGGEYPTRSLFRRTCAGFRLRRARRCVRHGGALRVPRPTLLYDTPRRPSLRSTGAASRARLDERTGCIAPSGAVTVLWVCRHGSCCGRRPSRARHLSFIPVDFTFRAPLWLIRRGAFLPLPF